MKIDIRFNQGSEDISLRPEAGVDFCMVKELISLAKCKEISTFKDNNTYISRNGTPLEGQLQEVLISADLFFSILAWAVSSLRKEIEK